ncbi:unnamed protein product [Spirodela intermedia]|uniref:FRIGIDA-like protein n=1 Tax=Spirodela intermedia TaxID=51605 RepID=A0A7I8JDA1_SPIIN|nr:unnamed protein product [Spirodela intermedia]CAA6668136.1 unnamed protein product [Spirodela intermedia]
MPPRKKGASVASAAAKRRQTLSATRAVAKRLQGSQETPDDEQAGETSAAVPVECGDLASETGEDATTSREEAPWSVKMEAEEDLHAADVSGPSLEGRYNEAAAAENGEEAAVLDGEDGLPSSTAAATATLPLAPNSLLAISRGVDDLRGLSTALSSFTNYWDDLCNHLGYIQAAMDALARGLDAHSVRPASSVGELCPVGEKFEIETEKKKGETWENTNSVVDLKSICERMLGRNLRRYVVAHLSEVDRLREEVPKALQLSPDPAKLVLSCMGRFYLQGSRAYGDPNSPMVGVRRACILVLEFFLLSGCACSNAVHLLSSSSRASMADSERLQAAEGSEPSISVREEAKVAAIAWKNRLLAEGGVTLASAVDALGLALFVASFGIPSEFDSEIIYDLFRMCNMKKKADILLRSGIVVEKLPDIVQDLVQKEKYMAAADLVCGFGLQEKHLPLDLISSFLIKTNTDASEERREGQSSMRSLRETTANQLAAYKSVVKCLEEHKLDASSLANFRIEGNISKLERELVKLEKKLREKMVKRKPRGWSSGRDEGDPSDDEAAVPGPTTEGSTLPLAPQRLLQWRRRWWILVNRGEERHPVVPSRWYPGGASGDNHLGHDQKQRSVESHGWIPPLALLISFDVVD